MQTHIAVQNGFPGSSACAELEFIKRFVLVSERLGIRTTVVDTSNDIIAACPDFVIATHPHAAKLTQFATLGLMWSPPRYFQNNARLLRAVRSYDGFLVGPDSTGRAVHEASRHFSTAKPAANFRVYPSAPSGIAQAAEFSSLAYFGIHWDGSRHGGLLAKLAKERLIAIYGPAAGRRQLREACHGALPFDGTSVIRGCARHGVVLCLHRDDHREADAPSMRMFEAASAGCVILSDDIPFARRTFADAVFVIPGELDDNGKAAFIRDRLGFVRDNPRAAREMGAAVKEIFDRKLSLDVVVPKIAEFGHQVRRAVESRRSRDALIDKNPAPIDVFIRAGNSEPDLLDRAIKSACDQTYPQLRIVLVGRQSGLSRLAEQYRRAGRSIETAFEPAAGNRSAPLAGDPAAARAPYFAWLDPADTWDPAHLQSLHAVLAANAACQVAYSGCILVRPDGCYFDEPNFRSDHAVTIAETRRLASLEPFDGLRLVKSSESIPPSGWLARADLLAPIGETAVDLPVGLLLLANGLRPAAAICSGEPTVLRHVAAPGGVIGAIMPERLYARLRNAAVLWKTSRARLKHATKCVAVSIFGSSTNGKR
jgi:hypothetical protein